MVMKNWCHGVLMVGLMFSCIVGVNSSNATPMNRTKASSFTKTEEQLAIATKRSVWLQTQLMMVQARQLKSLRSQWLQNSLRRKKRQGPAPKKGRPLFDGKPRYASLVRTNIQEVNVDSNFRANPVFDVLTLRTPKGFWLNVKRDSDPSLVAVDWFPSHDLQDLLWAVSNDYRLSAGLAWPNDDEGRKSYDKTLEYDQSV